MILRLPRRGAVACAIVVRAQERAALDDALPGATRGVRRPFPRVADHVAEAPGIRVVATDWRQSGTAFVLGIDEREDALPAVRRGMAIGRPNPGLGNTRWRSGRPGGVSQSRRAPRRRPIRATRARRGPAPVRRRRGRRATHRSRGRRSGRADRPSPHRPPSCAPRSLAVRGSATTMPAPRPADARRCSRAPAAPLLPVEPRGAQRLRPGIEASLVLGNVGIGCLERPVRRGKGQIREERLFPAGRLAEKADQLVGEQVCRIGALGKRHLLRSRRYLRITRSRAQPRTPAR